MAHISSVGTENDQCPYRIRRAFGARSCPRLLCFSYPFVCGQISNQEPSDIGQMRPTAGSPKDRFSPVPVPSAALWPQRRQTCGWKRKRAKRRQAAYGPFMSAMSAGSTCCIFSGMPTRALSRLPDVRPRLCPKVAARRCRAKQSYRPGVVAARALGAANIFCFRLAGRCPHSSMASGRCLCTSVRVPGMGSGVASREETARLRLDPYTGSLLLAKRKEGA